MESFVYQAAPMRVVFGSGRLADLAAELDRLSVKRALVLTTPQQKFQGEQAVAQIGDRLAGVYAGAVMHTPFDVTELAMQQVMALKADGVVAVGGGEAAQGLFDLMRALGAKVALRDLGMPKDGIERAADLAVSNAYWNPRPLDRDAIRDLIARAWEGEPPVVRETMQ